MNIKDLVSRLNGVKESGTGYVALCPGHNDSERSLGINEGDDGRVLLRCYVGCDVRDIVGALGLTLADLFPKKETSSFTAPSSKGITVKTLAEDKGFTPEFLNSLGVTQGKNHVKITYLLEDGTPALRQRIRRALRAKDGSLWAKGGGSPSLYGLWKLNDSREKGLQILVEGESDCWTLWHHGFPALGFPGADMTGKLRIKHVEGISKIYIIQEPDKGGDTFVAGIIRQFGNWKTWQGELFEVRLSELAGAKDPNDLHKKNPEQFKVLFQKALDAATPIAVTAAKETPGPEESEQPKKEKGDGLFCPAYTDTGNGELFAHEHKNRARYCYVFKKWLIYTGTHWKIDNSGAVEQLAKKSILGLHKIAAEMDHKSQEYDLLLRHIKRSLSNSGIKAMLERAQSEPGISVEPGDFNKDKMLFNAANCTIDLATGKERPHDPKDMISKISPVLYDPEAKASIWLKFLDQVMGGDDELINFLQRWAGYSLTGRTDEQCFVFIYGIGGNGKSRFVMPLQAIEGDYGRSITTEALMVRHNGGEAPSPYIARLLGARMVVASETNEGVRFSESLIKQLTGEDIIVARHLHAEPFEFIPEFKLWIYGNHKPKVTGQDEGIWRRVLMVPFETTIPKKKRDKNLLDKLYMELPGILTWVVQGCLEWQRAGLNPPRKVYVATEEYRQENNLVESFVLDNCVVADYASVRAADIYEAFRKWCIANGEDPYSQKKFGTLLNGKGFINTRGTGGKKWWKGLGLIDEKIDVSSDSQRTSLKSNNVSLPSSVARDLPHEEVYEKAW